MALAVAVALAVAAVVWAQREWRAVRRAQRFRRRFPAGPDGIVIPRNVIEKPPTAELRENQKDQDSLPPYDILDGILERLVEREQPIADIVAEGYDAATVMRVDRMLNLAEYKRRQAAPGVKVTLLPRVDGRMFVVSPMIQGDTEPGACVNGW